MLKHSAGLALIAALCLAQFSCKPAPASTDTRAKDDAQWRERQRQQAIKYYGELIKNFPDSPNVAEAKRKMEALGPAPTPAKR